MPATEEYHVADVLSGAQLSTGNIGTVNEGSWLVTLRHPDRSLHEDLVWFFSSTPRENLIYAHTVATAFGHVGSQGTYQPKPATVLRALPIPQVDPSWTGPGLKGWALCIGDDPHMIGAVYQGPEARNREIAERIVQKWNDLLLGPPELMA